MNCKVIKYTDVEVARRACEATIGKESSISLNKLYSLKHSPIRTQVFMVELSNIPLFAAIHLVRHPIGTTPFQITKRDDRTEIMSHESLMRDIMSSSTTIEDFCDDIYNTNVLEEIHGYIDCIVHESRHIKEKAEFAIENYDRNTPTDLRIFLNAESLMNIAEKRLCLKSHKKTQEIMRLIKDKVSEVDPDLSSKMVRTCVTGRFCCEDCGFQYSASWEKEHEEYKNSLIYKKKNR